MRPRLGTAIAARAKDSTAVQVAGRIGWGDRPHACLPPSRPTVRIATVVDGRL